MELTSGKTAVVTGAASGIGFALAERFARVGLDIVLADIEQEALDAAEQKVAALGVQTLAVRTDVSDEAAVQALAAAAIERFGAVHLVCNNAGVESSSDAWLGPISAWKWVLGVNLWGVIHGIRAFLPVMLGQGEGHFVNTASIAGLYPDSLPRTSASKHAVVAISEGLYRNMKLAGLPIGVSVLCPGWVNTNIMDADRNWPADLGSSRRRRSAPTWRNRMSGRRSRKRYSRPRSPRSWRTLSPPASSGCSPDKSGSISSSSDGTASPKARTRSSTYKFPACRRQPSSPTKSGTCSPRR